MLHVLQPAPRPVVPTFSDLGESAPRIQERIEAIWDLLAYVGRYGHQAMDIFSAKPLSYLTRFADALERRLKREDEMTKSLENQ